MQPDWMKEAYKDENEKDDMAKRVAKEVVDMMRAKDIRKKMEEKQDPATKPRGRFFFEKRVFDTRETQEDAPERFVSVPRPPLESGHLDDEHFRRMKEAIEKDRTEGPPHTDPEAGIPRTTRFPDPMTMHNLQMLHASQTEASEKQFREFEKGYMNMHRKLIELKWQELAIRTIIYDAFGHEGDIEPDALGPLNNSVPLTYLVEQLLEYCKGLKGPDEEKNKENVYKMLHLFRSWNAEWDKHMTQKPDDADAFVDHLSKHFEVKPKE